MFFFLTTILFTTATSMNCDYAFDNVYYIPIGACIIKNGKSYKYLCNDKGTKILNVTYNTINCINGKQNIIDIYNENNVIIKPTNINKFQCNSGNELCQIGNICTYSNCNKNTCNDCKLIKELSNEKICIPIIINELLSFKLKSLSQIYKCNNGNIDEELFFDGNSLFKDSIQNKCCKNNLRLDKQDKSVYTIISC